MRSYTSNEGLINLTHFSIQQPQRPDYLGLNCYTSQEGNFIVVLGLKISHMVSGPFIRFNPYASGVLMILNYRIRPIKRTMRVQVGNFFCSRGFVKHLYNRTPQ